MVDWSASRRPVTGADSVWYCLVTRTGDSLSVVALENPATRRRAVAEIKDILLEIVRREQMALVGFDFPYGYPTGSAAALGLTDTPAWLGVWREVASRIVDRDDNNLTPEERQRIERGRMDTRGTLRPASAAASALAASSRFAIDSHGGQRNRTASGRLGPDYRTGIP
jgi:hypothetical protein